MSIKTSVFIIAEVSSLTSTQGSFTTNEVRRAMKNDFGITLSSYKARRELKELCNLAIVRRLGNKFSYDPYNSLYYDMDIAFKIMTGERESSVR